jgi:hypothetical protein
LGHFYLLLAVGALVLAAFALSLYRQLARRNRLPYVAAQAIFSPAERGFLAVLERAVGRDYRVYGRVRVADVVGVRRRLDRRNRRRAFERIGDRRFDFLVCTAGSGAIACAVSLAPRSRLGLRPPRDSLDRICAAAGLPFVRFREGEPYSVVEIEERVFAAMQSVRIHAGAEEPPRHETQEALHSLAEAIQGERRGERPVHSPVPEALPGPGQGSPVESDWVLEAAPRAQVRHQAPSPPQAQAQSRAKAVPLGSAKPFPSLAAKPAPKPAPTPASRAMPKAAAEPLQRPRTEPTMAGRAADRADDRAADWPEVDEGPAFTIQADPEVEDQPPRLRLA